MLLIVWSFHWVKKEVKTGKARCEFMTHWSLKEFLWSPLGTHLSYQMTPGTFQISTPLEIAVGTQLHETKTTPLFLTANGEASWSLLSSLISLLSGGKMQPEKSYCCILKVTGQIWVSRKRISINIDHSYHQRSSFWISLNWSMIQTQF